MKGDYLDYCASVGFDNMILRSHCVKDLDEAVDIHIHLVRLRQLFRSKLPHMGFAAALRYAVEEVKAARHLQITFRHLGASLRSFFNPYRPLFRSKTWLKHVKMLEFDSDLSCNLNRPGVQVVLWCSGRLPRLQGLFHEGVTLRLLFPYYVLKHEIIAGPVTPVFGSTA